MQLGHNWSNFRAWLRHILAIKCIFWAYFGLCSYFMVIFAFFVLENSDPIDDDDGYPFSFRIGGNGNTYNTYADPLCRYHHHQQQRTDFASTAPAQLTFDQVLSLTLGRKVGGFSPSARKIAMNQLKRNTRKN